MIEPPAPLVVAMLNRKGGVGKSSCCMHLGGSFARSGKRVLLIDMDPQASLTQGFFGPQATEALDHRDTVVALFDDRCDPDPSRIIRQTAFDRLSIASGSNGLERHNVPEPEAAGEYQRVLRTFVREALPAFDVILIDCPPNLHLCSWNALLAADWVMVPLQAEDYGAQGITHVQRAIDAALAKYNPTLRLLGYLVSMFQRRLGVHAAYDHQLRQLYADDVFTGFVPAAKDFKEAVAARRPLSVYKPRSTSALAMDAIAAEMVARATRLAAEAPKFLHPDNRAGIGPEAGRARKAG
ncbi:ParA family protein [Frigoriglobus tundricola]|uniref:Chromosome (Plasmid) partitioning protein ParA n=1 Tax=Frigoriglobus tundricola TaxID=2774151 RepID=A0A6M5YPY7_9BACT|nr:ParA family protein [Frigoriglobus tundricola]QJW95416.1 Chromosome (plasmid) partitioning protein ParA [Frigoriglobus tundricola]